MKTAIKILICCLASSGLAPTEAYPETVSPVAGLPSHFRLAHGGCRAGRGYSFVAEAPDHRSTYPKLVLRVFNGEIIGMVFEVDASTGWKPWYDQPAGKPISHDGGPQHYSQAINIKPPPTASDCAKSIGPGKMPAQQTR